MKNLQRMCYSKKKYGLKQAKIKISEMKESGIILRYYICPNCRAYHLTSKEIGPIIGMNKNGKKHQKKKKMEIVLN